MATSKTGHPSFRVPGSMQIVGPTLSGKTDMVVQTETGCSHLFSRWHWRQWLFLSSPVLLRLLLANYVHKNATRHGCCLSRRNTNHHLRSVSPRTTYCWLRQSDGFTHWGGSSPQSLSDCGHTKPVCLRQAQCWNESQHSMHNPF